MKILYAWFILTLAISPSVSFGQSPSATSNAPSENTLSKLSLRIANADYSALDEVAKMPPGVAIPFLQKYINLYDEWPSEKDKAVRAALRNVNGYQVYLKGRLADATKEGDVDAEAFYILAAVEAPNAAAIIAPYLFDFNRTPSDGHRFGDMNVVSAADALHRLHLSEAPTRVDEYIAWQKWAIKKGLVAKEWESRVGVPDWLRQFTEPNFVRKQDQEGPTPDSIKELAHPSPQLPPAVPSAKPSFLRRQ